MITLSTNPIDWMTAALGRVLSVIVLYCLSYALGYASVSSYFFEGIFGSILSLPISVFTGWGLVAIPLAIYIFWALLYEEGNPYILLSIHLLIGAFICSVGYDEYNFSWYTLPILALPVYVLVTAWFQPMKKFVLWIKHCKDDGFEFDDP